MEMKTMLEAEINEFGDHVEYEYLVPIEAIKEYLDTDKNEEVEAFLQEDYISDDTSNIIDLCIRLGLEFKVVRGELVGNLR